MAIIVSIMPAFKMFVKKSSFDWQEAKLSSTDHSIDVKYRPNLALEPALKSRT